MSQNIPETTSDKHCRSVLEWANKSRAVAIVASVGSAVFLIGAVILEVWDNVRGSIIALIAAGMAVGIAALNFWSSGRAGEQLSVAYGRQYQVDMFNQTRCLYDRTKGLYEVPQLSKEADANHAKLVSEWLDLMKAIATQPVEMLGTGSR